jgi:predicted nucleotidyltransferase
MVGLVSDNLDRIRDACKRRGVSFLELVGSAARDDFDPNRSDIDVLVDFPDQAPDLFGAYMGLREDLAGILGRPVDVITLRGVRNPLLLESLRRDAIRLYAA